MKIKLEKIQETSTSPVVQAFQKLWNLLGYKPPLHEDGLEGPHTREAASRILEGQILRKPYRDTPLSVPFTVPEKKS